MTTSSLNARLFTVAIVTLGEKLQSDKVAKLRCCKAQSSRFAPSFFFASPVALHLARFILWQASLGLTHPELAEGYVSLGIVMLRDGKRPFDNMTFVTLSLPLATLHRSTLR